MKKTILTGFVLSSVLLIGASPIHDIMDSKLKGKSFGGTLNDYEAAQDGLGVIPLNGYSAPRDVANELIIQKVLTKVLKSESDVTKLDNIKNNLTSGSV